MSTTSPLDGGAGPAIDPRIRARRIEVRRTEGRRRLQRLVDLGLVLVVAAAFLAALWTPLLDVDAVEVTGAEHTGAAAVVDQAGVEPGDPLVSVDLRSVGRRVAALPWVADVHLERRLDGTVRLAVTERSPVAVVGSGADAVVVDADGRVLGPLAELPAGAPLPTLVGTGAAPAAGAFLAGDVADALALAARVAAAVPGALASLDVDDLSGVLGVGGVVRFGDARQLDAKARSLATVLDQVDLTCLATLDLRLPGSPVLTREQGCS